VEDVELVVLGLAFFSRQAPTSELKLLSNKVTLRAIPWGIIVDSLYSVRFFSIKNDDCQVVVNGGPNVIEVPAVIDSDLLDVKPFKLSLSAASQLNSGVVGQVV